MSKIRPTRFIQDILDLADEQGWSYRSKEIGFLLTPPKHVMRPGHHIVFISDPGNDSHRAKVIHSNLRQAGLKFPAEESTTVTVKNPTSVNGAHTAPAIAETPFSTPFVKIRARLNDIANCASEIEVCLGEIEAQGADVQRAVAALRTLGIGK